jgi:hypothetical protein
MLATKDMTKAQRERFHRMTERIFNKVDDTFGQTAEAVHESSTRPSVYSDMELMRTMEVVSGGVRDLVQVLAVRQDD